MKNLVLIVLTTLTFVACEQKEEVIAPTFKESVVFSVENTDFIVEDAIPAEHIKNVAEKVEYNGTVNLDDVWIEVKAGKDNKANMAVINIALKNSENEIQLLDEDIIVPLEDETSIVPLISVLSAAGHAELINKINDIVSGADNSNIELALKGESFYSTGTSGDVNVDMKMFIRYSF